MLTESGKAIEIEGGNYELDKEWYRCRKCFKLIEGLENHTKCKNCTLYGENVHQSDFLLLPELQFSF